MLIEECLIWRLIQGFLRIGWSHLLLVHIIVWEYPSGCYDYVTTGDILVDLEKPLEIRKQN